MPTVKVSDINIYYEVHGEGEPLLLIAGLGNDLTSWMFQTPVLSRKYRVVVFDNRGAGRTDSPDRPYSIEMMADDAARLLDALSIEKTHVLGVSMGGRIAQELALRHPKRVRSLILATTSAKMPFRERHVFETVVRMAREGVSRETLVRYLLPWLFTEKFFENPVQVQTLISMQLAKPYQQSDYAFVRQLTAIMEHDTRNRIGRVTAPTLVLVGRDDILVPVKLSEELAAAIPNAELIVLEGGGHGFSFEIPEKFNQAVLGFLAKVQG